MPLYLVSRSQTLYLPLATRVSYARRESSDSLPTASYARKESSSPTIQLLDSCLLGVKMSSTAIKISKVTTTTVRKIVRVLENEINTGSSRATKSKNFALLHCNKEHFGEQ